MLEPRICCKTAVVNSDIFVVGGYMTNYSQNLYFVEMFSNKNKAWCYKTQLPDKRNRFCICSFKQNLYVIGGSVGKLSETSSSCLVYNIKSDKWSQIADMNEKRYNPAF